MENGIIFSLNHEDIAEAGQGGDDTSKSPVKKCGWLSRFDGNVGVMLSIVKKLHCYVLSSLCVSQFYRVLPAADEFWPITYLGSQVGW
jgi:hypothetical protein